MSGINDAVANAGSQQALADTLGVAQQNVSLWAKRGYAPVKWVVAIEQATGVPREQLINPKLVDLVKPRLFD